MSETLAHPFLQHKHLMDPFFSTSPNTHWQPHGRHCLKCGAGWISVRFFMIGVQAWWITDTESLNKELMVLSQVQSGICWPTEGDLPALGTDVPGWTSHAWQTLHKRGQKVKSYPFTRGLALDADRWCSVPTSQSVRENREGSRHLCHEPTDCREPMAYAGKWFSPGEALSPPAGLHLCEQNPVKNTHKILTLVLWLNTTQHLLLSG